MTTPDTRDLLVERREDGVLWLTLNHPDSLSAMSGSMMRGLGYELERAAIDPAVRAIVITGAGYGFIVDDHCHLATPAQGVP